MNESAQTYHPRLLQERRTAQSKQIFRRRVGVLAVSAALAIPVTAAGGARPFANNVVNFAKSRVEMVKNAFDPSPSEQAKQTQNYLQAHPGQAQVVDQIRQTEAANAARQAEHQP